MCLWQKKHNGNFKALSLFTDTVRAPTATNVLLDVWNNYTYGKRHTAARRKNLGYKRKSAARGKIRRKKMLRTEYYEAFPQLDNCHRRFRWSRSLRRGCAPARLLGLWVRIPPEVWISVFYKCLVCCQVEVFPTDRSLVQRKRTECEFVTECNQVNNNNTLLIQWPGRRGQD
jgi:hypothetical protein